MRNTNSITIAGRIGKKPELKETVNKVPVVDFSIANHRDYKDRNGNKVERVNWINCRAYKGLAETICKWQDKGSKLAITGELTVDEWEDKTTGEKKWRTYVLVTEAEFLGGKSDSNFEDTSSNSNQVEQQYTSVPYEPYADGVDNFASVDEDIF